MTIYSRKTLYNSWSLDKNNVNLHRLYDNDECLKLLSCIIEFMKKALTLLELNSLVRKTIELSFPDEYWVQAEVSEVREVRGHCYMELIEKDEYGNTPVARASAKCWKSTWMLAKPNFERVTGQSLHAGLKVLLKVYPQFHENFGFSWIVSDIDPQYTMGDMARKRQEIIRTLRDEGVFDLNRELSLSAFANRIAVISSAGAAGYGDFCNQLDNNEYGFYFAHSLFPAVMQGERIEASVIAALDAINEHIDDFDCVVIIRGGGATSDLSGFDTLALAENVANFPLPVITGIGHERDESVLDMVSNTRVKTPTAAAAFLINNLKQTSDLIDDLRDRITNAVTSRMEYESQRLNRLSDKLPLLFSIIKEKQVSHINSLSNRLMIASHKVLSDSDMYLSNLYSRLSSASLSRINKESHRLDVLSERIRSNDPALLLKKGFSMTTLNGKVVRNADDVKSGDVIETTVENGRISSIVK